METMQLQSIPQAPTGDNQPTMSSREIAELVNSRHDDVKRSIERLAERGVIQLPPLADVKNPKGQTVKEYRIGKRDSYVIVAQLSPEFTARLVDRWQELENHTAKPQIDYSDPAVMLGAFNHLRLENERKDGIILELESEVQELKPAQDALDRIAQTDGDFCITDAAKTIQSRPKDVFAYMRQNGWIYNRPGTSGYIAYQSKIIQGLLVHKVTTILKADGEEKTIYQVRVTPKGLVQLAKLINPAVRLAVEQVT